MRISDWSSDVCSSDLVSDLLHLAQQCIIEAVLDDQPLGCRTALASRHESGLNNHHRSRVHIRGIPDHNGIIATHFQCQDFIGRSEEHTSELQSLMRTSYAVFCLKKKKYTTILEKQTVILGLSYSSYIYTLHHY